MKFVQFPNGKVWRVEDRPEGGRMEGTVLVPGFSYLKSRPNGVTLAEVSEVVTGSPQGLVDFVFVDKGNDVVAFRGYQGDNRGAKELAAYSPELALALMRQYDLTAVEVDHALGNLDNEYGKELAIPVQGCWRQIRCPAYPQECDYVRVVVDGYEVAYWTSEEWQESPKLVMGAFLGAVAK